MLTSGRYLIRNHDNYVGRNLFEDKSLLPKRVELLPQGIQAPVWEVEVEGDRAILKTNGAVAVGMEGHVFALLILDVAPQTWRLVKDELKGPDFYVIMHPEDGNGWVAPEVPNEQLLYRQIIAGRSLPPFYPPNESFQFVPFDRDY